MNLLHNRPDPDPTCTGKQYESSTDLTGSRAYQYIFWINYGFGQIRNYRYLIGYGTGTNLLRFRLVRILPVQVPVRINCEFDRILILRVQDTCTNYLQIRPYPDPTCTGYRY